MTTKKTMTISRIPHPASRLCRVEIAWEGRRVPAYDRLITSKIAEWLDQRGGGLVSVLFTSTERVADLNRKFRGVPHATAVMSFPQGDFGLGILDFGLRKKPIRNPQSAIRNEASPRIWGDVVIAADAVARYARLERVTAAAILGEFVDHGLTGLLKDDRGRVVAGIRKRS